MTFANGDCGASDPERQQLVRATQFVGWGAATWFVLSIVGSIISGSLSIDLTPFLLLLLLPAAYRGGVTAWTIVVVVLVFYILASLVVLTLFMLIVGGWLPGNKFVHNKYPGLGAAFALAVIAWSAVAMYLSIQARTLSRRLKRRSSGLCEHCAYDLKGTESDRCPECGNLRANHESENPLVNTA
jgi:hypothetical protein